MVKIRCVCLKFFLEKMKIKIVGTGLEIVESAS